MRKLLLSLSLMIFSTQSVVYAEYQVTHKVLLGVWSYFYILEDGFANDLVISAEQRLYIIDGQNAELSIVTDEKDFHQNTTYTLSYTLSLKDNTTYLTFYSAESDKTIGAYVRMLSPSTIEMAQDPNFRTERQLYKRQSPNMNQK